MPDRLSENPESAGGVTLDDVLSSLLSTIRLSGSLQFCFMPSGSWQTDATPAFEAVASSRGSGVIPFHIVAEGTCWLRFEDDQTTLEAGDVVLFPFGSGHQLGSGRDGRLVTPTKDLPPKPWREVPVLRYGDDVAGVRMLCGYLQCEALAFSPFSRSFPELVHVRTRANDSPGWLDATVRQMIAEVDRPRAGSVSMVPRLTEIIFIEVLRHQIVTSAPRAVGWLAALADPSLSRCLSIIHENPRRDWSLEALATLRESPAACSRSAFGRFSTSRPSSMYASGVSISRALRLRPLGRRSPTLPSMPDTQAKPPSTGPSLGPTEHRQPPGVLQRNLDRSSCGLARATPHAFGIARTPQLLPLAGCGI
jgi:hypothetical protein